MKSVALTEGKKPYFYDLNRQPGIKRNFSPEISHAAGLQQAGMGRSWLQRGWDVLQVPGVEGTRVPSLPGHSSPPRGHWQ